MTLEQLRIFIAVAEKQHVTRAASELNLTQSATSAAIAALEARYGIKLFHRVGRGIVLTQTGRDFLNEARAVVARAKAAAQVLDDLAGLKRGYWPWQQARPLQIIGCRNASSRFGRPIPDLICTFRSQTPSRLLKLSKTEMQISVSLRARLTIPRWQSERWKAIRWPWWSERAIRGSARRASRQSF